MADQHYLTFLIVLVGPSNEIYDSSAPSIHLSAAITCECLSIGGNFSHFRSPVEWMFGYVCQRMKDIIPFSTSSELLSEMFFFHKMGVDFAISFYMGAKVSKESYIF